MQTEGVPFGGSVQHGSSVFQQLTLLACVTPLLPRYELPRYVICEPTNLIREGGKGSSARRSTSGGGAVELPAVAAGAAVAAGSGGSSDNPDSQPETAPLAQVAVR